MVVHSSHLMLTFERVGRIFKSICVYIIRWRGDLFSWFGERRAVISSVRHMRSWGHAICIWNLRALSCGMLWKTVVRTNTLQWYCLIRCQTSWAFFIHVNTVDFGCHRLHKKMIVWRWRLKSKISVYIYLGTCEFVQIESRPAKTIKSIYIRQAVYFISSSWTWPWGEFPSPLPRTGGRILIDLALGRSTLQPGDRNSSIVWVSRLFLASLTPPEPAFSCARTVFKAQRDVRISLPSCFWEESTAASADSDPAKSTSTRRPPVGNWRLTIKWDREDVPFAWVLLVLRLDPLQKQLRGIPRFFLCRSGQVVDRLLETPSSRCSIWKRAFQSHL